MTKLTVDELIEAHKLKLRIDDGGCCWHSVLDDQNVKDTNVQYCIEYAKVNYPDHVDCLALAPLMERMSISQRIKLSNNGYKELFEQSKKASKETIPPNYNRIK